MISEILQYDINGGGINDTPNPAAVTETQCKRAFNIYFKKSEGKIGKYVSVHQRTGIEKVNSSALGGKVKSIYFSNINGIAYLSVFCSNGSLYDFDINSGAHTEVLTELDTSQTLSFAVVNNTLFFTNPVDGLYLTTDNVNWSRVTSTNVPTDLVSIALYDGRLFGVSKDTIYWSKVLDGSDWNITGNNMTAGSEGGDACVAIETLGNKLIILKDGSIDQIKYSGSTLIPYIRQPIQSFIGCVSKDSVKKVKMEFTQGEVTYSGDYLVFLSHRGLEALREYASTISISDSVSSIFTNNSLEGLRNSFGVFNSKRNRYILAYPEGNRDIADRQLVYHTDLNSSSQYGIEGLTAACEVSGNISTFILFGDKDGFIHKYDYSTYDDESLYNDNDEAYEAIFETHFKPVNDMLTMAQLLYTNLITEEKYSSTPITIEVEDELGNKVTEVVDTVASTTSLYDSAIASNSSGFATKNPFKVIKAQTGIYAAMLKFKFTNSAKNKSMKIYSWGVEMINTSVRKYL